MSGTQKIFNTLVFSFLMIIGINSALASVCYLPDEKCRKTKEVDAGVACDDVTRFSKKRQCLAVINDEVQTCQWDAVCYVPKCKLSYSDCEELINNFDSQYQTAECQEIDGCYKVVYGECEAGVVREGCSGYTVSDADKPAKVAENYSCPSSCEQKVVTKTCKNGKVKISEDTELMWKCSSRPSREQWEGCDESYVEMTAEEVKAAEAQNLTCNSCQQQLVRYSYDADGKENKEVKDRRTVYNCSCTKTQQNCSGGTVAQNQCIRGMEVLGNTCQRDGQTYGDCLDCADETNMNNNCVKQGYTTCCGNRTPIGEPVCDCGGVKYYAACQVVETCFEGYYYREMYDPEIQTTFLGNCYSMFEEKWNKNYNNVNEGNYKVEDKCTTIDLKKIVGYQSCTAGGYDCAGNRPPAADMVTKDDCIEEEVEGKSVECGGKTYYEKCTECGENNIYFKTVDGKKGNCLTMLEDDWDNDTSIINKNSGYYKVEDKCTLSSGKKVIGYQHCTGSWGSNYDCAGNEVPAADMVTKDYCSTQGKGVGGKTVKCGGETFYEKCVGDSNKDPCDTGDYYKIYDGTSGWCRATLEEDWNEDSWGEKNGYYKVEDRCTKSDGRKVIGYMDCQGVGSRGMDCAGNRPPALGLRYCADLGLYPVGNVVTCGGKVYSSDCGGECNSEMTENDCPDSFIPVCSDGTTTFGECGN